MTEASDTPEAGPSTSSPFPGPSPYQESSQFLHWRFSPPQLRSLRQQLNEKSVEVAARNAQLEKEAQITLGHEFTDPPPAATYLSVEDELLLLQHYCSQAAKIIRDGFQLPESVESTAVSYLKRFYLKNSVMEWHPKIIMPTCVYLAAKTTNYPISMRHFVEKFTKLNPQEILDHEFLVAQSLAFEFWVRGADKALRGWILDLQTQPGIDVKAIQAAVPSAIDYLARSQLTDAEFIYTPSQISIACLRLANPKLVDAFLGWKYATSEADSSEPKYPYGLPKDRLLAIISDVESLIRRRSAEIDLKKVKAVDKRLKSCRNPEKVAGTALYMKRKLELEAAAAEIKAEKTLKVKREMSDMDMVFGDVIQPKIKKDKGDKERPMSPRVSLGADRDITRSDHVMEDTGMGIRDEAMGMVVGGQGLKDVGKLTEEE